MMKVIVLAVALFIFPVVAAADTIVFSTGSSKEGRVIEETPTMVKIRIKGKVIGVSRDRIQSIQYATDEENDELEAKWKEEETQLEEQRKQRLEQQQRFDREQEAKGLRKVNGEWVSPSEAGPSKVPATSQEGTAAEGPSEEESQLPDFVNQMSDEQKAVYFENIKKVSLSNIDIESTVTEGTRLTATLTNKGQGELMAVLLSINCYDAEGEQVFSGQTTVDSSSWEVTKPGRFQFGFGGGLSPGASTDLSVELPVERTSIARYNVKVINVEWK